jgi:transglutaminase-like putative cysteine protease
MGACPIGPLTMKYEIDHRTSYTYRHPVAQSCHVLHLEPRLTPTQKPLNHSLLIEPAPKLRTTVVDFFGNSTVLLTIDDEHSELILHARSTVEVTAAPRPDLAASSTWDTVAAAKDAAGGGLDPRVVQFACPSRLTPVSPAVLKFARAVFPPKRPVLEGAFALTRRIFEDFAFDPKATDVSTPVERVLATRRGVCQDFAHLALASLRALGIPARYVSGYLLTRPPPGQVKLRGADASHAWLAVWSPESGWVDFDPTNGVIPSLEHVTTAWGRDYDDICPIGGVLLGGGDQVMSVGVDVDPVG